MPASKKKKAERTGGPRAKSSGGPRSTVRLGARAARPEHAAPAPVSRRSAGHKPVAAPAPGNSAPKAPAKTVAKAAAPVKAASGANGKAAAPAKAASAANGKAAAPRAGNGTPERKRPIENGNGFDSRADGSPSDSAPAGREAVVAVAAAPAPRGNPPALPTPIATFTV